jgi:hypothetical protein
MLPSTVYRCRDDPVKKGLAYLSLPLEEQLFKREFFQPFHRREGSLWIDQSSPGFGMTSSAGWSARQS